MEVPDCKKIRCLDIIFQLSEMIFTAQEDSRPVVVDWHFVDCHY